MDTQDETAAPAVITATGLGVDGEHGPLGVVAVKVEFDALESALRELRTIIRRSWPIGRGGNPHLADELVVVPATIVGKKPVARAVFARWAALL